MLAPGIDWLSVLKAAGLQLKQFVAVRPLHVKQL